MSPLGKTLVFSALLAPLALASTDLAKVAYELHSAGQILAGPKDPWSDLLDPEDTDLIGAEEPGVTDDLSHWRGVTDAVPAHLDRGQVTSAWASNLEKAKHDTEASADDELNFEKKVYNQRLFDKMATDKQLAAIKRAVSAAADADDKAVSEALDRKIAVHKAAAAKMARAAQAAEAHSLKMKQAQAAALEGQTEGTAEGAAAAAAKRAAWNDQIAADAAKRSKAEASAAAAKKKAAERAAVNKVTSDIEAGLKQDVAKTAAWARSAEAQHAAAAALEEAVISGDEELKNTDIMHDAELAAESSLKHAKSDQETTDQASIGRWP